MIVNDREKPEVGRSLSCLSILRHLKQIHVWRPRAEQGGRGDIEREANKDRTCSVLIGHSAGVM